MRDVMHLDDRGVVADRSQPGKDNGATLVELKGDAVALVFDRQDVAWKSIAWSLFTAPERLEATGEILPAGEVPFTLPRGVKFCIVNPDEVRFYNRNSLGMTDRAVDILVGVGVFQQVTHRAPSRAARKQYRTAVKSRLRDLVNQERHALKSRKERKPMKRLKNMAAAIGRTPARMLNGMRRRSAGLGDLQQMIKGQDLLKDARSVAGQRRQIGGSKTRPVWTWSRSTRRWHTCSTRCSGLSARWWMTAGTRSTSRRSTSCGRSPIWCRTHSRPSASPRSWPPG